MNTATEKLNKLKRISFEKIADSYDENVLLYKENETLSYKKDKIYTESKECLKDLLRVIEIIDPLTLKYKNTKVLMPRVYAEKHSSIPQHISVQCLFFHKIKVQDLNKFIKIIETTKYNKTSYDKIWIKKDWNFTTLKENDILYIMNRRVGGWDGSIEKPVIELLCAGGHLPTIWNEEENSFKTLKPIELLQKEIKEEVGLTVLEEQFIPIGGFHNEVSNELVALYALFIDFKQLQNIISYSKENYQENIDGIYMGIFEDIMQLYEEYPNYFAGGEKAKPTNFPSNTALMKKIKNILEENRK